MDGPEQGQFLEACGATGPLRLEVAHAGRVWSPTPSLKVLSRALRRGRPRPGREHRPGSPGGQPASRLPPGRPRRPLRPGSRDPDGPPLGGRARDGGLGHPRSRARDRPVPDPTPGARARGGRRGPGLGRAADGARLRSPRPGPDYPRVPRRGGPEADLAIPAGDGPPGTIPGLQAEAAGRRGVEDAYLARQHAVGALGRGPPQPRGDLRQRGQGPVRPPRGRRRAADRPLQDPGSGPRPGRPGCRARSPLRVPWPLPGRADGLPPADAPAAPLVPSAGLEPANALAMALLGDFRQAQQQMAEQFQQSLLMMFQMFSGMHQDQMGLIREELAQIRRLAEEQEGLRAGLAGRQGDLADRPALRLASTGPATEARAPAGGPARPAPPRPDASPEPGAGSRPGGTPRRAHPAAGHHPGRASGPLAKAPRDGHGPWTRLLLDLKPRGADPPPSIPRPPDLGGRRGRSPIRTGRAQPLPCPALPRPGRGPRPRGDGPAPTAARHRAGPDPGPRPKTPRQDRRPEATMSVIAKEGPSTRDTRRVGADTAHGRPLPSSRPASGPGGSSAMSSPSRSFEGVIDHPDHSGDDAGGIVILVPVYNDWSALGLLLEDLDATLARADRRARVVIVDDGSTAPPGIGVPGPGVPGPEAGRPPGAAAEPRASARDRDRPGLPRVERPLSGRGGDGRRRRGRARRRAPADRGVRAARRGGDRLRRADATVGIGDVPRSSTTCTRSSITS